MSTLSLILCWTVGMSTLRGGRPLDQRRPHRYLTARWCCETRFMTSNTKDDPETSKSNFYFRTHSKLQYFINLSQQNAFKASVPHEPLPAERIQRFKASLTSPSRTHSTLQGFINLSQQNAFNASRLH
ncbi:hypothetical protein RRG08_065353 [Elysia crispata]|uniref:Secreted protein n=1 Tax=Elysia crispata TaxID=231223 RepID=A0AAE1DYG1_9GAST|nr:hypothetical protein RRG08_065353 [Elysia crispata]